MIAKNILSEIYFKLSLIRKTEEKIALLYPEKEIKCPCHLCVGQEAIAVGVCANLNPSDKIVTFYRGQGHFLAKGGNIKRLMAELYGKSTGANGGRGGSMLLSDPRHGIMFSSAIVGGGISIAAGLALASKIKKDGAVSVSFFGDAAVEEGVFHESLNLASLYKLPIIFVCENNSYAVGVHISKRQPRPDIIRFAQAHDMRGTRVDGNDVVAIYKIARNAVSRARNGLGPTLIECVTNRLRGHIESFIEQVDNRGGEEIKAAWEIEPLKRYTNFLIKEKMFTKDELEKIDRQINLLINKAVAFAKSSPFPNYQTILKHVYPK